MHPFENNYYHVVTEGLVRIMMSAQLPDGKRAMLPHPSIAPLLWELIDLFNISLPADPILFVPNQTRYKFKTIHIATWRAAREEHWDFWRRFVPPKHGMDLIRGSVAKLNANLRYPIVYIARDLSLKRSVFNEEDLISSLRHHFGGRNVFVFRSGSTIRDQINLYRSARVVIGPHGTGLTNIAW